ncbi:MAG: UDP-N-acetylglucosamine 2-epimerase (non-hydrolyzing) [Fimbriimonadaceae bacterium]|nr:UDP-N-acetylglucosamine 2-epimerase (non-hydrolyzing) [Fimbriimonadaceae bacterium]QYK58674.1 MAG: UDP-N-acetylglucosamine 2-epimerase (non-hydrolyzing) [Fimbriimonadaceae bacterium]
MAKPRAVFVVGTRPDAIKSAPVVLEFQKYADKIDTVLVSTGQHRELLDQALGSFGLRPDLNLDVMSHGQTLAELTARIMTGLDDALARTEPSIVLAQGDTTTTFLAGLSAFYRRVPFAHVEAGLRTPEIDDPFPEEFNRRAVGLVARLHFPPTRWSADNLLREGVAPESVFVTGNTGIDAVKKVAEESQMQWYSEHSGPLALVTTHRRENWGEPQLRIARAVRSLADRFPALRVVVPMHRNPSVRETLRSVLDGAERIDLIEPPDYPEFVKLIERCTIVLTDSGGIQEEAPAFGKPALVMRETTERPEGVEAGTAKLVGTDEETILREATSLLSDPTAYAAMAQAVSPYGDGRASARIRYKVCEFLGIATALEHPWT